MDKRKNIQCCKCGKGSSRATRFVCLSCGEVFCKNCYNEGEEINNHKSNHPVQQVLSKSDLELFYGGASKKSVSVLIKEQPITCPCCGERGLSSSDLVEHMLQQHHSKNSNKVLCPLCLCGFESISKESEFYGKNILQHFCIYHQLMPYYDDDDDDDDDDDGDERNDDDDDDDDEDDIDDDYDDPPEMPGDNKVVNKLQLTGQKRRMYNASYLGPGGDGYAVRKSITFLNIEGEPFTFGEDYDNQSAPMTAEIGAGDSRQGSNSEGIDLIRTDATNPLAVRSADRNGVQSRGTTSIEDSPFSSVSKTGLVRRNAMRSRGQVSRQRMTDPLVGGRSRVFLNNCDAWDIGAFIASHDNSSQRSKRNSMGRGLGSKMPRGGGSNNSSVGGRRAEPMTNLRHHFEDLLDDCMASNILRDSSVATELLTYLRRKQESNKITTNTQSPGYDLNSLHQVARNLSFEERRMENDRMWRNLKKLDGGAAGGDKARDTKSDKKQRTADNTEPWAQALDYDAMDYLADFDRYDEFYDGAEGYEFFEGDVEDEYDDDEEDDDDDDDEDVEDRAARFCAGLRNARDKNVVKVVMSSDNSKIQTTKQTEKEAAAKTTTDTKQNEEKEKFLLGTNFWNDYHTTQQDEQDDRANEGLFVQELFFAALNALSLTDMEDTTMPTGNQISEIDSNANKKEEDKNEKNNNKEKNEGNKQVKRKGESQKTKQKHQEFVPKQKVHKIERPHLSDPSNETKPESVVEKAGEDNLPSRHIDETLAPECISHALDAKLSRHNEGRDDRNGSTRVDSPAVPNNHSTETQNNYGARPKDRSYHIAASRNSLNHVTPHNLVNRKSTSRRSSSGFVSSSSKASSSSSSLLSSNQEIQNGRKKSSKNSSAVSSNSNLSDFSSVSHSPAVILSNPGLPASEVNVGIGLKTDGTLTNANYQLSTHFQGRQTRSDSQPTIPKVATRPVAIGSVHKKPRPIQTSFLPSGTQMSSSNGGTRNSPALVGKGVVQQNQSRGNARQLGSNAHPSYKSVRPSVAGSGNVVHPNIPGNNSSAINPTVAPLPTPGGSSNNNGHPSAENSKSNKPSCNNTRSKNILPQKDKTSFR